jgi:hypothetical protein
MRGVSPAVVRPVDGVRAEHADPAMVRVPSGLPFAVHSPAGAGPFDAGVELDFTRHPPELLVEGDPAEPRRAELDAQGGPGLSITGMPGGLGDGWKYVSNRS